MREACGGDAARALALRLGQLKLRFQVSVPQILAAIQAFVDGIAPTQVDPALIGGAVVRAGDTVIDGSLKSRLERMAFELTA